MLSCEQKAEWTRLANEAGADVYWIVPRAYPDYTGNSRGIGTDPFAQLPEVSCVAALVWGFAPLVKRENPQLSGYYVASHKGHLLADGLLAWLHEQGAQAVMADLPVRAVLESARLAAVGRNGLAAMKGKGSFFYAKLILTDAFAPEESDDLRLPCVNCGRCEKACPAGAIGAAFTPLNCIREHLDGRVIGEQIKRRMPSLLGCEVCQRVCPRNAGTAPAAADETIEKLFSFTTLIADYPRKEFSAVVGKNMTGGGRLRAQALILAARAKHNEFEEEARELLASENDCLADAARWYLDAIARE